MFPTGEGLFAAGGVPLRLESALAAPEGLDFGDVGPVANREASQVGCAESRCLNVGGAHDGAAENVGLELHEEVIRSRGAIDAEFGEAVAGVGFHGFDEFAGLIGDRLQCGAPSPTNAGTM